MDRGQRFKVEMRLPGDVYATVGSRPWDKHGLCYWRRCHEMMTETWPRRYYRLGPIFWSRDVKVKEAANG